jgi:hypothetical protein
MLRTLAQSPMRITQAKRACSRLVRIMPPTALPRRYARRPRHTLRSHDCQRASRKLSVHAAALFSPCAKHVPHCTAQALRAVAAANATPARSSSKFLKTRPRAKGGRGVRYARTIYNAHHISQACMLPPCARLVRIMSPTVLSERYGSRTIVNAHWQDFLAQPRPPGASFKSRPLGLSSL